MIEARFGLKHRPFDKAIDSRKLYVWPGLEELGARLEMSKHSQGILLLTGEPGTGKTVALRRFVDSLNSEHYLPVYLPLSTVTVIDAYTQLNRALGGQEVCSKSLLFREIQNGIAQLTAQGKQPVVILDEADLMRSPPCTTPPPKAMTSSNSTTSFPPARRSSDAQSRSPYVLRS